MLKCPIRTGEYYQRPKHDMKLNSGNQGKGTEPTGKYSTLDRIKHLEH